MTEQEAIMKLERCQDDRDTERAHMDADDALCEFLDDLGLHDLVTAYKRVDKWYA